MLDRKEGHEDLTQAQKDERENKLREEQSLIAAAEEFTQVSTEILVESIDMEGAFNTIRDFDEQSGRATMTRLPKRSLLTHRADGQARQHSPRRPATGDCHSPRLWDHRFARG